MLPFHFTYAISLSYNKPKLTSDWIGSTDDARSPTSAIPEFDTKIADLGHQFSPLQHLC